MSRDHIAMVAVRLVEITRVRSHRLMEPAGQIDVLGNLCRVMTSGRHLEFWIGSRRFEISLEDLVATAGQALEARLRAEIRDRVIAAQRGNAAPDGGRTQRPTVGP